MQGCSGFRFGPMLRPPVPFERTRAERRSTLIGQTSISFRRWALGFIPNRKRKWTIGEGSRGRDTRLACPWERERTSEPLVPTSAGEV